jgi:alpha-tubulin suppressor-like RCC1 family protein
LTLHYIFCKVLKLEDVFMKYYLTSVAAALIFLSTQLCAENIIRTIAPVKYIPPSMPEPEDNIVQRWSANLSNATLPYARVGQYFAHDFNYLIGWSGAGEEVPKPTLTLASDESLPNGLSFTAQSSLIAGIPTTSGDYALSLHLAGDLEASPSTDYFFKIYPPISLSLGTVQPEPAAVYSDFNFDLSEHIRFDHLFPGDLPPDVTWSASTELPSGITLTEEGVLTGAPKAPITSSYEVSASNGNLSATRMVTFDFFSTNFFATTISQSSADHACAINLKAAAKCWGNGSVGRIGNGSTDHQSVPTQVSGLTSGVVQIETGFAFACALLNSGKVMCWGSNSNGKLGINSTTDSLVPVEVMNLSNITQISLGDQHVCALSSSGAVSCWGLGVSGRLGDGATSNNLIPNQITLSNVTQISSGSDFTCAVNSQEKLYCWGNGQNYSLGTGNTSNSNIPVLASMVTDPVKRIFSNEHGACITTHANILKCWGNNGNGQLGVGDKSVRSVPTEVVGLGPIKSFSGINAHHCAVTETGAAKCWGHNSYARLGMGFGNANDYTTPQNVLGYQSNVSMINAGYSTTCIISDDGDAKCWGENLNGKLGDGTTTNKQTPTDVLLGD